MYVGDAGGDGNGDGGGDGVGCGGWVVWRYGVVVVFCMHTHHISCVYME